MVAPGLRRACFHAKRNEPAAGFFRPTVHEVTFDARPNHMAWIGPNQSKAEALPGGRYVSTGEEAARAFLQRVYLYMSVGLAVTGLVG